MYDFISTVQRTGTVHATTGQQGPEGEQRYSPTPSLTSLPDEVGWSMPCSINFTPAREPNTHCTVGWVGPRDSLDRCGKSCPHQNLIPRLCNP